VHYEQAALSNAEMLTFFTPLSRGATWA
jgi:hypothetical protein